MACEQMSPFNIKCSKCSYKLSAAAKNDPGLKYALDCGKNTINNLPRVNIKINKLYYRLIVIVINLSTKRIPTYNFSLLKGNENVIIIIIQCATMHCAQFHKILR